MPTQIPPPMLSAQLERFAVDLQLVVRERNQARAAVRKARLGTLLRLAAAAELKDDDTGVHILRMGHYAALIAAAYGMPPDYCENILYASRMHDIGKIGIPDAILKKPGPLTDEEWVVMKTHPEIGAALLDDSDVPLFQMASQIALTHHEKFDGSGYPSGLRGSEIPLSGRIVAVADYFDALTMDRCYRPALPMEKAFNMLRANACVHFDPSVVQAFFEAKHKILDIRTRINRGEEVSAT
ncbi:MAG: HD-GYP domain-containing protein [Hydrogenophilales bacterium]|nr:HD-GYP domain-containing protein [Hydrogenophilales bacterium]